MFTSRLIAFAVVNLLGFTVSSTLALGTECKTQVKAGTAAADDPYWLGSITHQGISAFNDDLLYSVFRNVKDYGAVGDGVADDTDAINAAISDGSRCGQGCNSTTTTPALVYFPQGTYLVSESIVALYYTAIIGDARIPPTIVAAPSFTDLAVIDADPYLPGGINMYQNQNNFYRSIRNIVIDLTRTPSNFTSTGIHWQVSQATSLVNVVVNMSEEEGTAHRGLFMENGSGGFMGDIVLNGGQYGLVVGNQQFTVRNVTVNNAVMGIQAAWNWGWTFQRINFNNCSIGFGIELGSVRNGTTAVGSEAIIDVTTTKTPTFIQLSNATDAGLGLGSLVLSNIRMSGVTNAIETVQGEVVLSNTSYIDSYAIGNVYSAENPNPQATNGPIASINKPGSLLTPEGAIFGRGHPMYADYAVDQIVSVRSEGALGDGIVDDTDALNAVFAKYSGCKIIFVDAGTYLVSSTLKIPAGTQMVGEAWSVIMVGGPNFANENSAYVGVQVGEPGDSGVVEISDIVFTTRGPAPGAIVVEWNVAQSSQGSAGMWDSYIRLGATAGTNMNTLNCANTTATFANCAAAYLGLHLTSHANAYLEGTWVWTSDHDLDSNTALSTTVYTGRGILSESQGPLWMIGVASEHAALYQFNLNGASNHYLGLIQTESPYYQPNPAAPAPFHTDGQLGDPTFGEGQTSAWALYIHNSSDILVYGAALYSFYGDYSQACGFPNENCQSQIVDVDEQSHDIGIYSLSTVDATYQLSVGGSGVISQGTDADGFASTAIAWTS